LLQISGYRTQRAQLPRGFQLQLPPFDSDVRPVSYAYIIVGPRFRGKFNAKKAEELGVFRQDRAALTRGESVTVKVEVDGKTVLRTVTPDQVLAKSEPPAVG
jgi:ribonuclease Z